MATFPEAVAAGKIKVTGNPMRLGELMALMDEFPRMFEIVEPKRTPMSDQRSFRGARRAMGEPKISLDSGSGAYAPSRNDSVFYSALLTSLMRGSGASIRLR